MTTGLLNAVVAEDLPGPGTVFLRVEWDFRAPVRPGDEITAEVEVLEVRDDKPIAKLRTTITNQDGTVVVDGTALVWVEPPAEPHARGSSSDSRRRGLGTARGGRPATRPDGGATGATEGDDSARLSVDARFPIWRRGVKVAAIDKEA